MTIVVLLGLFSKDEIFEQFVNFYYRVENEKSYKIDTIRSDHGKEFENTKFDDFCNKIGYMHEYSTPHTSQQNKVVERKNRTLQELVRTMLHEYTIPKFLWVEAVNTACHVVNRVSLRLIIKKIPYELWIERKPNLSYFKVFGLNEAPKVNKFDSKSIEGIFVGYSSISKAYRIYIPTSQIMVESVHVKFDETINIGAEKGSSVVGDEAEYINALKDNQVIIVEDEQEPSTSQDASTILNDEQVIEMGQQGVQNASITQEEESQVMQEEHNALNDDIGVEHILSPQDSNYEVPTDLREVSSHHLSSIISDPREGVRTRSKMNKMIAHCAFVSQLEPKIFKNVDNDSYWICAMQEELNQFERNQV
jgi:hypothetical protein